MELEDAPSSWKSVKLVFLRKPEAVPKKEMRSYSAAALTSVMSKLVCDRVLFCVWKGQTSLKDRKQLHVGGMTVSVVRTFKH